MSIEFVMHADVERLRMLTRRAPENPFVTAEYLRASVRRGAEAWLLADTNDTALMSAALLYRGRLNTGLHLVSTPPVAREAHFWSELRRWLDRQAVTHLHLESFGSAGQGEAPDWGECTRSDRAEFIVRLDGTTAPSVERYASNLRRNLRRAQRAGLQVMACTDTRACVAHARLMNESAERRFSRAHGRAKVGASVYQSQSIAPFVSEGAGRLFQAAVPGAGVVASVLLLEAALGAYYHSAGASEDGLACGAPTLLVHHIIQTLRGESKHTLNLGGATPDQAGLLRFKQGFRGSRVPLDSVICDLRPAWRRRLGSVLGRTAKLIGRA